MLFAVLLSVLSCGKAENTINKEETHVILEGTATNSRFYSNNSFFNEDTVSKAFAEK